MSRLFETIRFENGVAQNLAWHERRMNHALREFWRRNESVNLGPLLTVPHEFSAGTVRCNILYGPTIHSIVYKLYKKQMIRSLKLVSCDTIDYHVKYTDRSQIESLLTYRAECDEIIIVKNGLLTDTSMSNIIFRDRNKWITPANPLLKGTCRERLIAEGSLFEQVVRPKEIPGFSGCKIINAMRNPDEEMMIPVSQIFQ